MSITVQKSAIKGGEFLIRERFRLFKGRGRVSIHVKQEDENIYEGSTYNNQL